MALDIKIGKYKISSEAQNIILQEKKMIEKGEKAGQEYFASLGFYGRLEDCCKSIIDREIKQSDCKSLKEVVSLIQQVKQKIDGSLKY